MHTPVVVLGSRGFSRPLHTVHSCLTVVDVSSTLFAFSSRSVRVSSVAVCVARKGLIDVLRRFRFQLLSPRHYRLKTFAKRIFPRCRALLSGRDVTRVRHDAMGVAS